MGSHVRDKQSARRMKNVSRVLAVVFGFWAVAGAAGMFSSLSEFKSGGAEPSGGEPEAGGDAAESTTPVRQVERVDNALITDVLGALGNAPEPVEVAVDEGPGEIEPLPEPPSRQVRYIGTVRSGGRVAAFLNIAGVTKMLRPGQSYDGVELVSVDEDEIRVNMEGSEGVRLERSERTASAVSVVTGGAPADAPKTIAGQPALAPDPEFSGDMSREERRAQLLERARSERSRWQRDRGDRN